MFDCFMMNEELDVVDVRLNTLATTVEKFIIVESSYTHSGKWKPLHFAENRNRFEKFLDKIIYIEYKYDGNMDPWFHENAQRDICLNALNTAQPSDGLLFISDADEIPKPSSLIEAKSILQATGNPVAFSMTDCIYYMNFVADAPMKGPFLYEPARAKEIHDHWTNSQGDPVPHTPTAFRWHMGTKGYENDFPVVTNSGWHFSALGGIVALKNKIESCAHVEFNIPTVTSTDHILKCIQEGTAYYEEVYNFHGTPKKYTKTDLLFLPQYIQNNLDKFRNHIL